MEILGLIFGLWLIAMFIGLAVEAPVLLIYAALFILAIPVGILGHPILALLMMFSFVGHSLWTKLFEDVRRSASHREYTELPDNVVPINRHSSSR